MQYILANNRKYTTDNLRKLQVNEGDTIIICNNYWHNRLPDWKNVRYICFIRNIKDFIKTGANTDILKDLKPERIYFVNDPGGMDLKFANQFKCFKLDVPAKLHDYPSGYPSTGFMAVRMFSEATLVGFESTELYNGNHFHNWDYEHGYIELNRKNILL